MSKFKSGLLILCFAVNFSISGHASDNPFKPQLPQPKPPEEAAPPSEPIPPPGSSTRTEMYDIPPAYNDPLMNNIPPSDIIPEKPKIPVIPPAFDIQGIIWQTDRPQAIINDQVVDVGDALMDSRIVSIEKAFIQIEYQGILFNVTP